MLIKCLMYVNHLYHKYYPNVKEKKMASGSRKRYVCTLFCYCWYTQNACVYPWNYYLKYCFQSISFKINRYRCVFFWVYLNINIDQTPDVLLDNRLSFFWCTLEVGCLSDKRDNFWRINSHSVSDSSQLLRHITTS